MFQFALLFACGEKEEVLEDTSVTEETEVGDTSEESDTSESNDDVEESVENLDDEEVNEESEEQNENDTPTEEPETSTEIGEEIEENTGESETTGTGSETCSSDDLVWRARVEDDSGSVVSPFSTTTSLMLVGEVENTCDGQVVLNTMTDCVVYSGTLYANSGLGTHLWTNPCQVGATTWVFAPYETKSQTEVLGSRPADHYELTIYFADASTHMAYASFDVE